MRIYTRGGDKGKTGIHGGQRVEKDDIRIETNGCLDELNSMIGVVRAFLASEHEWHLLLYRIQKEIMVVMSNVATTFELRDKNPNPIDSEIVLYCEKQIDLLTEAMGGNADFILPGGTLISSHLHMARTIARRSERRLWTLHRNDPLPEIVLQFVNRLSDLFFVMARYEMFQQGTPEEKWKDFLYKRKK